MSNERKNENDKDNNLPFFVLPQRSTKTGISSSPLCAIIRKRHIEKRDGDLPITLDVKKPRGRIKQRENPTDYINAMENLRMEMSDPTSKASTSRFQASRWSNIDQNVFQFVSRDLTRSDHSATDTPSSTPALESQIKARLEARSFNAESTKSVSRTQQRANPDTGPIIFVSALEIFDKSMPGCNAIRRFEVKPNRCLANKRNGTRCGWELRFVLQNNIKNLLTELALLNIYIDMQKSLDKLDGFVSMAVCYHHRDYVRWKLRSLLQACRPRDTTPIDSLTSNLETESNRVPGWSKSGLVKRKSKLNLAQKEKRETETLINTSAFKITYWLREPPNQKNYYLPEFRPYQASGLDARSLRDQVREKAKEPLRYDTSGIVGKFQWPDELIDGYIYIYWNRLSFGFIHIGYTTRDVDQRLQNWEDKCQHIAEEHYRSPFRIKHVARVVKLIYTEFSDYRVFVPFCHGCGATHTEWFTGLDLRLVIRRIEDWTEWIMKEPYEKNMGYWRPKDNLEFVLPQIYATAGKTNSALKGKSSIQGQEDDALSGNTTTIKTIERPRRFEIPTSVDFGGTCTERLSPPSPTSPNIGTTPSEHNTSGLHPDVTPPFGKPNTCGQLTMVRSLQASQSSPPHLSGNLDRDIEILEVCEQEFRTQKNDALCELANTIRRVRERRRRRLTEISKSERHKDLPLSKSYTAVVGDGPKDSSSHLKPAFDSNQRPGIQSPISSYPTGLDLLGDDPALMRHLKYLLNSHYPQLVDTWRYIRYPFLRVWSSHRIFEPPLHPSKVRVRWQCRCGLRLHDDFTERRHGAAVELQNRLNRRGSLSHATNSTSHDNQSTTPIRLSSSSMSATDLPRSQSSGPPHASGPTYDPRPHHEQEAPTIIDCYPATEPEPEAYWLLVCAKDRNRPTQLLQMDVKTSTTDRFLFERLKAVYYGFRGRWSQKFSLRSVQYIRFVQFELYIKDLVDVRKVPDMPSEEQRKEYHYEPCDLVPPVGENLMAHWFNHPEDADTETMTCLLSPKKRKDKLKGAFGVSAYIVTVLALVLGILQMWQG